ncbi:hypothetical protein ACFLZX_03465 [Nanoarchaeota archaeon]
MNVIGWLKKIYGDKFKRYLILGLIIIGIFIFFYQPTEQTIEPVSQQDPTLEIEFFYHPTCPHCAKQKEFNNKLNEKYPGIKFNYHDTSDKDKAALLLKTAKEYGIDEVQLGVPATFIKGQYFIGFQSEETPGKQIEDAIIANLKPEDVPEEKENGKIDLSVINVPLIGEINPSEYSLPTLAIVLGFIDGFNPCAMWVLVYLISLIVQMNDRRKIWILVGSFVAASGILYFLFMTAWLNVFLLMGVIRPLTLLIGLFAIGIGINDLKTYFSTKGDLQCEVGDIDSKKKTMSRISQVVHSPLTIGTIFGIIGLAFVVNSIEFVCSSAIPVVFTQTLAVSNISTVQYYLYMLLYVFFFMLDDLVIFGSAALLTNAFMGQKYAKFCKLIGGIVLLALGLILTFMPEFFASIGA